MSLRNYRRDVNPYETDTKGRLFGLDVSINWPSNRHWQTKELDSWKAEFTMSGKCYTADTCRALDSWCLTPVSFVLFPRLLSCLLSFLVPAVFPPYGPIHLHFSIALLDLCHRLPITWIVAKWSCMQNLTRMVTSRGLAGDGRIICVVYEHV